MHCLHPDDDQNHEFLFRTLFPPNEDDSLKNIITSSEFKLLLKTDATTTEGLQYVANYFGMRDSVDWTGSKDALQQYHQLLFNIKEAKPKQDCVWISFWEGMHRHSAIIMALLSANVSHDTNKCYIPDTLEKWDFEERAIKGFNRIIGHKPDHIIRDIFRQKDNRPKMLQTEMTINAYIPMDRTVKITELMRAMTEQSRHVCENKLNSAKRTVSSALADWLHMCSPKLVTSVHPSKEPDVQDKFKLHTTLTQQKYSKLCAELLEDGIVEGECESEFGWYPNFVDGNKWLNYVKNPFNEERKKNFDMKDIDNKQVKPPYRITLRSITVGVTPPTKFCQYISRKHINSYQIIPGIMYELIARLSGKV